MFGRKNNKTESKAKTDTLLKEDYAGFDDDEFFMAEEIDGYDSCSGLNAQRCTSDCFTQVMLPTISTLS